MDKGLQIIRKGKRKILAYEQFSLGDKYKIFTKNENGSWQFCISFKCFGLAIRYYDKMFDKEDKMIVVEGQKYKYQGRVIKCIEINENLVTFEYENSPEFFFVGTYNVNEWAELNELEVIE